MQDRKKHDYRFGAQRLRLAAMGMEAEFALAMRDQPTKPEDVFGSPRDFIRGELMHRVGTSYHLPTAGAIYFDTGVIEIATPAIEIERGCAARAGRSLWESIHFVRDELDAWDRWNYARTDALLDAVSARYVAAGVYGVDDLDHHGTWRVVPTYGAVWVPDSVPTGWVPYSTGRWILDPFYGWTWVDTAPWGWAPFHHGRWVHVDRVWAWAPGPIVARPVFAPALVASVLLGLGTALAYPTLIAAVSDVVTPRERAPAVGVYRFWRDAGFVAGAVAIGIAADGAGTGAAIAATAVVTALSGVWVALVRFRPLVALDDGRHANLHLERSQEPGSVRVSVREPKEV